MTERIRVNANDANLGTRSTWENNVLLNTYDYVSDSIYDVMTDHVTPDFHRRKAAGEVIMSPMDHIISKCSQSVGGYSCLKGGCSNTNAVHRVEEQVKFPSWTTAPSTIIWSPEEVDDAIDHVRQVALTQAYANVEPPYLEALVSLVEAKKTLRLIQDNVTEVAHRARKGFLTDKVSFFDKWLEGRYGWRPLVYEIMGAIDYFNSQNQKPKRKRALASDQYSDTVNQVTDSGSDWNVRHTDNLSYKVTARAGVLYDWSGDRGADIQNALGLNRPLTVLWELLPYSFVVDWFTTIGNYFQAWSPKAGVNELGAWCTVKVNATYYGSYAILSDNDPDVGWCLLDGGNSVVTQIYERQLRTIHTSPPLLPTIDFDGLNPQQILDSIALMRNILKKGGLNRIRI